MQIENLKVIGGKSVWSVSLVQEFTQSSFGFRRKINSAQEI
jgi:hypothetical protein